MHHFVPWQDRARCRDYDPEVGRWTAKDPLEYDGGDTNFYAYADPINFVDAVGLAERHLASLKQGWNGVQECTGRAKGPPRKSSVTSAPTKLCAPC